MTINKSNVCDSVLGSLLFSFLKSIAMKPGILWIVICFSHRGSVSWLESSPNSSHATACSGVDLFPYLEKTPACYNCHSALKRRLWFMWNPSVLSASSHPEPSGLVINFNFFFFFSFLFRNHPAVDKAAPTQQASASLLNLCTSATNWLCKKKTNFQFHFPVSSQTNTTRAPPNLSSGKCLLQNKCLTRGCTVWPSRAQWQVQPLWLQSRGGGKWWNYTGLSLEQMNLWIPLRGDLKVNFNTC